ncbi:SHOCT domain-containing protein [Gracilimonas sediminicola]|jgi:putative membrane protein|uniref:SHOCT domain-containing protein n=1 Tax=Gracilimonas sediminicola TaxID=2952158 RepID=A0A9X2L7Q0_9BACT|nr:SHOCT domain-containing protein [Gracilimonas sediminicola]MCP9293058.1 SHOCT domain-containing protein [Gracilimonas sediminicola]
MHDFQFFGGGWMMFIWWFLLIALVIVLLRPLFKTNQQESESETPLEILKRRYANGEIDQEEFEKRKKDLM